MLTYPPEMEHLPPEVVILILSKATLTTLIQCRRVCKSWLAALSDPAILRSQIKLPKCLLLYRNPNDCSTANSRFLHLYDHRDIPSQHNAVVKLAAKATQGTTDLVGHCNGLLCWRRRGTIYVSNPLIGESMTILTGEDYLSRIGFGFVPNKKQYKLVYIVIKNQETDELEARVQTLGSGTWKCLKCPYKIHGFGVHANGALNWFDSDDKICFLDLETDRFGRLPSPPIPSTHRLLGMVVIKDWITVWCEVSGEIWGRIHTWMMMEYGVESSWTEFKARGFDGRVDDERPLIFYRDKSLILCTTGLSYSWSMDKARQLYVYEHNNKRKCSFVAIPFGDINEAIPGFVPTFVPMENLLRGL